MQLLTEAIKKALPPMYATEKTPLEEKRIVCKFFTPDANATWYILEGSPIEDSDDWEFFCYADLGMGPGCSEFGTVWLSQLKDLKGPFGLGVERDYSFDDGQHLMKDYME